MPQCVLQDKKAIESALEKPEMLKGLCKYKFIMDKVKDVDVSVDMEFQDTFNDFYGLNSSYKDETFKSEYYSYMQSHKNDCDLTFREILEYLKENTGQFEASFSSKLLHTINPKMQILDKHVLINLGIYDNYKRTKNIREKDARYSGICMVYSDIRDKMSLPEAKLPIELFDKKYLDYSYISDVKKIDFILWQAR